jgi:nucleobase:cation symporter-1, NCS1 family
LASCRPEIDASSFRGDAKLYPERIDFRLGGLIASIVSVMVCPWIFVSSPQAITIFVSIFGAALGPMFGIMVADYYLVKRQQLILEDLYTMSPDGSLYFSGGWNRAALIALAGAGFVSIGLSLLGAYAVIPNFGDWGWLIGAALGAALYTTLMRREAPSLSRSDGVVA